jgi:fused signal recognition particle receptor
MPSWLLSLFFWAVIAGVAWFFVYAYRKARRRRRAEFADESIATEGVHRAASGDGQVLPQTARDQRPVQPAAIAGSADAGGESSEALEATLEKLGAPGSVEPPADERLRRGVERTRSSLMAFLAKAFHPAAIIDSRTLTEIEEALLLADVGVHVATRLTGELREQFKQGSLSSAAQLRAAMEQKLRDIFAQVPYRDDPLKLGPARPHVVLFVGANGVGKTTTIGKVAALLRGRGHTVILAAGDTFRAAAVEQLGIWAERTGCEMVRGADRADPASVVFRAIEHAVAARADVVLADTAGRLHTKTALMDELKKVQRAAQKARAGAPDQVWLVLDATTGQNALTQAREFHDLLGLNGVILTKLDGTAKGGVVIAIADVLHLPVLFVGVGETSEDLRPFVPRAFVEALLRVGS